MLMHWYGYRINGRGKRSSAVDRESVSRDSRFTITDLGISLIVLILSACTAQSSSESEWQTSTNEGSRAYHRGNYTQAESLLAKAVELAEQFDQPDPRLAESLHNLAEVYRATEHFKKAESLYWRSLPIHAETVGPEHPTMASSITGLARLYQAQGKFQEAEPLFNRALAINEKSLGEDHPEVAKSLTRYASLLLEMGRKAEATRMRVRAQSIEARAEGGSGGL